MPFLYLTHTHTLLDLEFGEIIVTESIKLNPVSDCHFINALRVTLEWIKMWCVCVCVCVYIYIYILKHNGILLSHKKEGNNAICSNMDGPRDCYTE